MLRLARPLAIALLAAGCAPEHALVEGARSPDEELGLPLIFPAPARARPSSVEEAPPPEPAPPPLPEEACSTLRFALPATHHGVIAREAVAKAWGGAAPALREAVCACPPRADESWIMVTTTPDRGDLAAESRAPDAAIDACLARHLRGVSLPRWHLGTDCIGCGPRRYGVLPGSPPVDSAPADGVATITFLVGVAR